jgi:hypothetical protein
MSAPKPEQKRLDGSVQNTVYQTNKRGKPIIRARNRTQINRKILRHGLGAAKMLERCAASLQNMGWADVLLGECRIKKCDRNAAEFYPIVNVSETMALIRDVLLDHKPHNACFC